MIFRGAREDGVALVIVLLTLTLAFVLGAGLALTTSSEAQVSMNFRTSEEVLYAADAAAEWAMVDLPAMSPDWPTLLGSGTRSSFVDGAASGTRPLQDGSLVDVSGAVADNAGWRIYAYGPLRELLPPVVPPMGPSPFYVMVFVAADAAGANRLRVRAEAFGPRGARKTLDLNLLRDAAGVQATAWAEVR